MSDLILPNKISWSIDLSGDWEANWSKRSLKNVVNKLAEWESRVGYEVLDCKAIKNIFYPYYQKTVMLKKDYRLDPDMVRTIVEDMSSNDEYQLLWFTSRVDGQALGGNVLHLFPDVIKGVYRAFDHTYALQNDMRNLDYYTDYILQKYVVSLGKPRLNRGLMGHPCIGLGLSMFKFRTGALPKKAKDMPETAYSKQKIGEMLNTHALFAYYDQPDSRLRFKRLTIITKKNEEEIMRDVGDTLERVGMDFVVQAFETH